MEKKAMGIPIAVIPMYGEPCMKEENRLDQNQRNPEVRCSYWGLLP